VITTQTTLGHALSDLLNIPLISLDAIYFKPGWEELSNDEFRTKVREALQQNSGGWIVDGKYRRKLGTMVDDQATDIICMFSLKALGSQ
jgi:hypothetical protein